MKLKTGAFKKGYWLAGDAAYDCADNVITPWPLSRIRDPVHGAARDAFSFFHSSIRIHVEQAFGIAVARFGLLWRPLRFYIRKVPIIVTACMSLHNYCIDCNEEYIASFMTSGEIERVVSAFATWWRAGTDGINDSIQGRRRDLEANEVRDILTAHLSRRG
jgi:DDE superfamily endonuclease